MLVKALNVAASFCGMIGTILLFVGSFAYESLSPYSNMDIVEQMRQRNRKRRIQQRLGVVLLVAAWPYVRRARNPQTRMFAAYLLFASVFSLVSAVLFFGLTWLMGIGRMGRAASTSTGMIVFLVLVFGIAFLIARVQIKRPPRAMQPPD